MFSRIRHRVIASGLLLAIGVLALATSAEAHGNGAYRRYKGVDEWQGPQRVYYRGHSDAGPALAGLIGGFILGTAVSHAQPVVVHERVVVHDGPPAYYDDGPRVVYGGPRYRYYDPADDEYFDSLDECAAGFHGYHRYHIVQVIDVRSGACARTLRYGDGRWQHWDDEDQEWDD